MTPDEVAGAAAASPRGGRVLAAALGTQGIML
jgi:hypothetical protein